MSHVCVCVCVSEYKVYRYRSTDSRIIISHSTRLGMRRRYIISQTTWDRRLDLKDIQYIGPAAPAAADDANPRFELLLLFPLYHTYQLYRLEDATHPRASM